MKWRRCLSVLCHTRLSQMRSSAQACSALTTNLAATDCHRRRSWASALTGARYSTRSVGPASVRTTIRGSLGPT
jgi:hypothetical protein